MRKKNLDPASRRSEETLVGRGEKEAAPRTRGGATRRRDGRGFSERGGARLAVSPRFWRHGGTARTHNPQSQFGRWSVRTLRRSVRSPDYSLRKCDSAAVREASVASRPILDFQVTVSTIRVSIVRENVSNVPSARPDGNLGPLCCCDVPKLSDRSMRSRSAAAGHRVSIRIRECYDGECASTSARDADVFSDENSARRSAQL